MGGPDVGDGFRRHSLRMWLASRANHRGLISILGARWEGFSAGDVREISTTIVGRSYSALGLTGQRRGQAPTLQESAAKAAFALLRRRLYAT